MGYGGTAEKTRVLRRVPSVPRASLRSSPSSRKHLILSNNVPELPGTLHDLGLDGHLHQIFNSAQSGYEKPHPRAFGGVLEAVANAEAAWMVGDSPAADVRGAEAVGLPTILVRGQKPGTRYHCADLYGIIDIVDET